MESSSFGRIVSVLTAPAKTFRSIAERPTSLVAILLLVVLSAGVSFLIFTRVDGGEMVRTQLEKSDQELTEAQMEQAVSMGEKMKYLGPIATAVLLPIIFVVFSGVFLIAFKVQASEIDFRRSLSVFTYAMVPSGVKALLMVPVALSRSEISVEAAQSGTLLMSNLAFLAREDASAAALAAWSSADVFSVWMIVLLSMGYSMVGKVSRSTAAVTVVVLWILGVAIKIGLAFLGGG